MRKLRNRSVFITFALIFACLPVVELRLRLRQKPNPQPNLPASISGARQTA